MSVSSVEHSFSSCELAWERLMRGTRYGQYADGVESALLQYVLSKSAKPGALLDVGCEGGRWSKVFADIGWRVTSTDVDPKVLRVCQTRVPNARCVLVDPNSDRLEAEDESVDVALCVEVGPVIHTDWAIPEFARVLKGGGRLVGVCWNRSSWRGFFFHNVPALRSAGSDPLVGFPIKYRDFRRRMIEHGFRFEKEMGYAWGPFRRTSNSRLVTLWASLERYSGLQRIVRYAPMVAFVSRKEA